MFHCRSTAKGRVRCLVFWMLVVSALPARGQGVAGSSDAGADDIPPEMSLQQRRERAETLRPRLEAMREQYESRTFDDGPDPPLPYRLFKPKTAEPGKKYPLVVYLHGSAGRGTDNLKQISGGNVYGACVWSLPEDQAERPCFVLAPQLLDAVASRADMAVKGEKTADDGSGSPIAGSWRLTVETPTRQMTMELAIREQGETLDGSLRIPRRGTLTVERVTYEKGALAFATSGGMSLQAKLAVEGRTLSGTLASVGSQQRADRLADLIRALVKEFALDPCRIYITGQSMGGSGTWGMLKHLPEMFAAAVPVCGMGDVDSAGAIVAGGSAIWAFHGDADPTVPVEASRRMAAALRAAGGQPRYTEYPGVKHDSWVDAYTDPALHAWLFQQSRRE
jgi:dienelactone hydrolase